eukprot:CAMPEP_0173128790 /NCGR_PEP_ID=MMETSP1102-20130122/58759_1 /TAXON_ID=49646 /ORGANISM="Geminigera sp., Strain Caron Lab Isolate" /LENGTH=63 /DNA_ID=CAMNT_0014038991 /DNA_START=324 /DNA_END=512 /DNA_ORIENTATION=+
MTSPIGNNVAGQEQQIYLDLESSLWAVLLLYACNDAMAAMNVETLVRVWHRVRACSPQLCVRW